MQQTLISGKVFMMNSTQFSLPSSLNQDTVNRLSNHIDQLKLKMSKLPPDIFFSFEPTGRAGFQAEIDSYLWLKRSVLFCLGEQITDAIRGTCHISSTDDKKWLQSIAETYLKQKEAGMCCLLGDEIDLLQDIISFL